MGGKKKKSVSAALKAKISMPPTKVRCALKESTSGKKKRVSAGSGVYLAAVLESFVCNLFEEAIGVTVAGKRKRITCSDLSLALRSDPELSRATAGFCAVVGNKITGVNQAVNIPVRTVAKDE